MVKSKFLKAQKLFTLYIFLNKCTLITLRNQLRLKLLVPHPSKVHVHLRQGLQSYRPASIFLMQLCTCNITEIKISHFDMHFFILMLIQKKKEPFYPFLLQMFCHLFACCQAFCSFDLDFWLCFVIFVNGMGGFQGHKAQEDKRDISSIQPIQVIVPVFQPVHILSVNILFSEKKLCKQNFT